MTATTMAALSVGRFLLGLGTSGPQVMEGWHGVRFERPVQRMREIVEIVRLVTSGGQGGDSSERRKHRNAHETEWA